MLGCLMPPHSSFLPKGEWEECWMAIHQSPLLRAICILDTGVPFSWEGFPPSIFCRKCVDKGGLCWSSPFYPNTQNTLITHSKFSHPWWMIISTCKIYPEWEITPREADKPLGKRATQNKQTFVSGPTSLKSPESEVSRYMKYISLIIQFANIIFHHINYNELFHNVIHNS